MSASPHNIDFYITPGSDTDLYHVYTVGRHPRHPELYAPDIDRSCVPAAQAVMTALVADEQDPETIILGEYTFRTVRQDTVPPELTRCSPTAVVDMLVLVSFDELAAEPLPPTAECPVCLDRPVVPVVGPTAFTEQFKGEHMWCRNGHGVCTHCASGCTTRGTKERFVFKCPVCRDTRALTQLDIDTLVLGSQYRAYRH